MNLLNSEATGYSKTFKSLAQIAFWATLILTPFRYRVRLQSRPVGNIYGDYTDYLIFASDVALILTLLLWLIHKSFARQGFSRGPAFVAFPMVALILVSIISVFESIDPPLSLYHILRLILLAGFSFYVIDQVHNLDQIAFPILVQVGIQTTVGIGQFLQQADIGLQALGEYLLNPEWNGVSVVLSGDQRWLRAYGLSDHPNILGGSLAFGLLVILGHYLATESSWRFMSIPVFVSGTLALFFTFSRSGWLAFGGGLAFLAYHVVTQKRRQMVIRGIQLLLSGLLVLTPFVLGYAGLIFTRLPVGNASEKAPTERQSVGERVLLNEASTEVFIKNPILGVGIGSLPQAIRQEFPEFSTDYQPAHFTLLDAAAEIGLFGAAVYLILLIGPWVAFSVSKEAARSPTLLTASAVLLAATLIGFFDYYTWLLAPGRLWQYFIWGLWAAAYRSVTMEAHVG